MSHLPTDALTQLALTGAADDWARDAATEHLSTCARCRAEVDGLRVVADRIRTGAVQPEAPPPAVWDRIAVELELETVGDGARAHAPSRRARRRRFGIGALVAACAASAAVAATIAALAVASTTSEPETSTVAQASLEPLVASAPAANARVVEQEGRRLLVIDADALPAVEGYLDVWLLDPQAQQMVSIGVLDRAQVALPVPDGLDLEAYPVVDVSAEPFDGDPTHSGDSIWRGALEG